MQEITFEVPGEPKGKGRPRFARRGKFVHTYTPESTRNYEDLIKLCFMKVAHRWQKVMRPLSVQMSIEAVFVKAKSCKRNDHTTKPDADNLGKCAADALNGIAFDDDSQVNVLKITKAYGPAAKLVITLQSL